MAMADPTARELIRRLLDLADGDPENRYIYRELQELKSLAGACCRDRAT